MNATQFRDLTPDECRRMREDVQQIIQPYMRAKLDVMQRTIPTMTATRHDDHFTITTSWPPEVQQHMDRCDRMCEQAVANFLQQRGYTLRDNGDEARA